MFTAATDDAYKSRTAMHRLRVRVMKVLFDESNTGVGPNGGPLARQRVKDMIMSEFVLKAVV